MIYRDFKISGHLQGFGNDFVTFGISEDLYEIQISVRPLVKIEAFLHLYCWLDPLIMLPNQFTSQ